MKYIKKALELPFKNFSPEKLKETLMQWKKLSNISNSVMTFFNKSVTQIDNVVKFVKRKSKVDARLFTEVLIAGCLTASTVSLERLCLLMKERKVKITKQGLQQRFNAEATLLMKQLFDESLKQFKTEQNQVFDLLKFFNGVDIQDSTGVELVSKLKETFKGCGGAASEAGLKIQLLFDYLKGQMKKLTITSGNVNDQGFDEYSNDIEKGVLYLRDLGYFKLSNFKRIHEAGGYFISRYMWPVTMLKENGEPLELLNELKKEELAYFSKEVFLGKKEKVAIRLTAFRLPDEEVEKRIRKAKRNAQRRGENLSEAILKLARWSIYITNVPKEMLSNEHVHLIYTLRWQIELFFKLCKSDAGIDKVNGRSSDRILCELYAKMICIVLLLYFCFPMRWKENQEISFSKAFKLLKLRASDFFKSFKSFYRMQLFLKSFLSDLDDFSFKEKNRKKKPLTYQRLMGAAVGQEVLA